MNRSLIIADTYLQMFNDNTDEMGEAIDNSDLFVELPGLVIAALNAAANGDNSAELKALGQRVLDCVEDFIGEDRIDAAIAAEPPLDYPREHDAAHASSVIDRDNASECNHAARRSDYGCLDPLCF